MGFELDIQSSLTMQLSAIGVFEAYISGRSAIGSASSVALGDSKLLAEIKREVSGEDPGMGVLLVHSAQFISLPSVYPLRERQVPG